MLHIHIHGPFMIYMYVPISHKFLQHDVDRFVVDTNHKKYPCIAVLFSESDGANTNTVPNGCKVMPNLNFTERLRDYN